MRNNLIIFFFVLSNSLLGQTNVSGGIFSNTTWTKSNSPYIVTGDVVVFPGVELTIEPGVEVRFNDSTLLEMRGSTLFAIGTSIDSITFTSNSSNPWRESWKGLLIYKADSIVTDYVNIQYAFNGFDALEGHKIGVNVKNTTFRDCFHGIWSMFLSSIKTCKFVNCTNGILNFELSKLDSCQFINNDYATIYGSECLISNSLVCGNDNGINCDTILNCNFVKNGTAILNSEVISNTIIAYNDIGISDHFKQEDSIVNNSIFKNKIGVQLSGNSGAYIKDNNICNNDINLKLNTSGPVSLINTCWCETDSSSVAGKIFDAHQDVSLGLATFMPVVNCSSSVLPPDPDTNCANSIDTSTGIWNNSNKIEVIIFPNPAVDVIYIKGDKSNSLNIVKIFNTSGMLVFERTFGKMDNKELDVSNLGKGLFLMKLVDSANGNIIQKKFLVK